MWLDTSCRHSLADDYFLICATNDITITRDYEADTYVHCRNLFTVDRAGAFHAGARGSVPCLGGLKETKMLLPHSLIKLSIVGSIRDWEGACSASDLQGLNFEFCVRRAVSSHHPREVLFARFSLYLHKSGIKPDSLIFFWWIEDALVVM